MLLADRFLALDGRTIDLASGAPVLFRRFPALPVAAQLAWNERCAARGTAIDYGVLNDGERFEVFGGRSPGESEQREPSGRAADVERIIRQACDVFRIARSGEPRCLHLLVPPGNSRSAVLDTVARDARLNGFVPISVELLLAAERGHPPLAAHLARIVENRHVVLVAQGPIECHRRGWCAPRRGRAAACPVGVARVMLSMGVSSARPHVLLLVTPAGEPRSRLGGRPFVQAVAACQDGSQSQAGLAAEAHEPYRVVAPSDFVRARTRAAGAMAVADRSPSSRAEHALRDAMGALARRDDRTGAGCVTLSLGCLLLERGRALEAARIFETARQHFDRANDLRAAIRAAVYVGLAWTDDGRLSEAEAACRAALIAVEQTGLVDLQPDVTLGLARCLYWQERFDEAAVLVSALGDRIEAGAEAVATTTTRDGAEYPDGCADSRVAVAREPAAGGGWTDERRVLAFDRPAAGAHDPDGGVRLASLAARVALARGDLPAATANANRALDISRRTGAPIDACVARTVLACVSAAINDVDAVLSHVRDGLAAARRAHAPLRALRLRLIACDSLRGSRRETEAARLVSTLARLDPARFPGLLRARVQLIVGGSGAAPQGSPKVLAACPWRRRARRLDVNEDVVAVLRMCHDVEDEDAALSRVCNGVRERTRAASVAIVGRDGDAAAALVRSGPAGRSTLAERVLDTGQPADLAATGLGLEAGCPVRYAGTPIAAIVCRWPAGALLDAGRVACLLSAAAAAIAPFVRSALDIRHAPRTAAAEAENWELVGVSEALDGLRKAVARAAAAPFPVLVEGESGSGKELVARAIHRDGPRRSRKFCALNCAALTDELAEAELFGHARGAFTGAVTERAGLFEEADGGTLFLDEVADLSARAQAKLLRAVQDGEVRRIGENFSRHVDARVIAATNRQLDVQVKAGSFRRDLFYRLNVVHIDVPPLRDRPEDVPVLARHFWTRATARTGSRATLSPATLAALARYDWPGNVRELQNVMAALAVSAPRRGSVGPRCLPAAVACTEARGATLEDARRTFERRLVRATLARCAGHRGRAAAALGISRQGLAKLMARLGLTESGEIAE